METAVLNLVLIALRVLFVLVVIMGRGIFTHWRLLGLFFGVYFADNLLILLTNHYSELQFIPNHLWEGFLACGWSGKLYSILFALGLLILARPIISKEEVGFKWQQQAGSLLPAGMVVLALSTWALVVGFASPKGALDVQTLLYLAIMPGLNEELVYRGFLLGALDKALPGRINILGAPVGWGVIVSAMTFGLLHGLWLDEGLVVHFEAIAFRNAFVSGLMFAWLRERTGSLVLPVIAHGLEDVLFFLPRML